MSDTEALHIVVGETARLVKGVREDQWDLPTPCPEWDVRTLVGHVVRGDAHFTAAVRDDGLQSPPIGDPAADLERVGEEMVSVFSGPGALERKVVLPSGTLPGAAALWMRVVEHLVHGWDLARATKQRPRYMETIAETALEFSRGLMERVDLSHRPFADPQPVAADAPALDRLAALLGRSV